ncbi:MAG: alkaline phosphatase PhoX [Sulfuricellaceae bacterium]
MFIRKTIALAVAGVAAMMAGTAYADSVLATDCVLNWAERTYPGAFAPAGGATQSGNGFSYRYYPTGNAYFGVQNSENYFYYLGPLTNNALTKIDPLFHFLSASKCATGTSDKNVDFAGIPYPVSDADKRSAMAAPQVHVNGNTYSTAFNTILRSGQTSGSGVFGQVYDSTGKVIRATDGSARISDDNDHSTLIDLFGKVFMVSQFESRPAAFYITELSQNTTTGKLTPVSTKPIDFSALGGGWVHCAGMRTPWKSHLGSEEYEPDARMIDITTGVKGNACEVNVGDCQAGYKGVDSYYGAMGDYFGGDMKLVKPYRYGYIVEAKITGADMGEGTFASNVAVTRHYAMGRTANEMAYVMPDGKTTYITDDGNMVGLYMYKADKAEDLSTGTLYAARLTQTSADNGGAFTLSWINLGSTNNAEIQAYVDGGITFADMFDAVVPGKDANGAYSCADGYTGVSHGHASQAGNTYNECLKLKTGNGKNMTAAAIEKAAAHLETRRYAAMKGATTELNKEEGITFNPEARKLYIAMSDVTLGMKTNSSGAKSTTEAFAGDHIRLTENRCGVVYELDVDANYQATAMRGLVAGKAATGDKSNTCDVSGIANPDNLTYLPGYNTLIIGEDTGSGHQNDLIWAYNLSSKSLTRILSTPYGSETTSPYFYPNVNGWGYLMGVVQHPYGESDTDKVDSGSAERRAYTGYIGPFPRMD